MAVTKNGSNGCVLILLWFLIIVRYRSDSRISFQSSISCQTRFRGFKSAFRNMLAFTHLYNYKYFQSVCFLRQFLNTFQCNLGQYWPCRKTHGKESSCWTPKLNFVKRYTTSSVTGVVFFSRITKHCQTTWHDNQVLV